MNIAPFDCTAAFRFTQTEWQRAARVVTEERSDEGARLAAMFALA